MKKILVPTDFSACATAASEMALMLAKKSGAELIYLHLEIDPSGPSHVPGAPTSIIDHEIGQAKYKLSQLVKGAENIGVKAKSELVLDMGQEKIEHYIKPFGIDWLVMGSHGASGIRETILGSKTQQVVRNVTTPSLVVKHIPDKTSLKSVVFASTFNEDTNHALQMVVEFCKLFDCRLHLLFVNMLGKLTEENAARLRLTNIMKRHNNVSYTINITETNDQEFGIDQFAQSIDADIISVAMEKQSTLGRILNPALAEQLINHSLLPVLVVKPA